MTIYFVLCHRSEPRKSLEDENGVSTKDVLGKFRKSRIFLIGLT